MTKSEIVPLVSIGMSEYNRDKFIREALDSLLAQTFTDFELIISDNASTDATEIICREYAAHYPQIRYVRQRVNRGAPALACLLVDYRGLALATSTALANRVRTLYVVASRYLTQRYV